MDRLTTERRSEVMSRVRSKDTAPELAVRRTAHALGYRFRLHRKDLPGKPDLIFPKSRIAIFVHGCFCHQHPGCLKATIPRTRSEFWQAKLERNVERDAAAVRKLEALGWTVEVIWECDTNDTTALRKRLQRLLKPSKTTDGRRSAA